jgi:hypothetical protein
MINERMNIVDRSTYTNQYQLLISSPTLTPNSTLQTIQQNVGFNQILDLQPIGGCIKLSQNTTALSNLNVSGNTTLNNATTINSSLHVVGNIIGSGTALTILNCNSILNPPSIISFNNPGTFISTLNISENATLNNYNM